MNSIDNIMALHDEACEAHHCNGSHLYNQTTAAKRQALRTAIEQADDTAPQPQPKQELVADHYEQADGSKNCMQCAAAYMLGLPVEVVPDFERQHSSHSTAWELMEEFFEANGCTAEMLPPNVEITGDYLASGATARGTNHMVVMRGGKLLHDPHPSNAGLESVQVVWVIAKKAGYTTPQPQPQPAQQADDTALLRQALEALKGVDAQDKDRNFLNFDEWCRLDAVITAIEARLNPKETT